MPATLTVIDESILALPDTSRLLAALREITTVQFVTAGSREEALTKLVALPGAEEHHLANWMSGRITGRMDKTTIDPTLTVITEHLGGVLGRRHPIPLRRGPYYAALDSLRRQIGVPWSRVHVIGADLEADLALPWALGAQIGLVPSSSTPHHDIEFVEGNAGRRCAMIRTNEDALSFARR